MARRNRKHPAGAERTACRDSNVAPTGRTPSPGRRRRTAIAIAAAVVAVVVLFGIYRVRQTGDGEPTASPRQGDVAPIRTPRGSSPLVPAEAPLGAPVNTLDPTSGKPIVAGITSVHKGYTIGHCCATSRRQWEALSEARKDALVKEILNR